MIASRTYLKALLALLCVALCGECSYAQKSDLELLREASFDAPREDRYVPYGIEPGRKTLSPLYHLSSGGLWLWENLVAADVCAPGGYTDTNTHYFKALTLEYGTIPALFLGFDRVVRNTKIGRASSPKNSRGLVEDDPKRYRQ